VRAKPVNANRSEQNLPKEKKGVNETTKTMRAKENGGEQLVMYP